MDPIISIIIPAYNCGTIIEKGLKSLQNQKFKRFEAIIINDGSTDETQLKIEKFIREDDRFKIISQKHKGVSAARNTGLMHAKGKYIAWMDADDWMGEYMLTGLIDQALSSEADILWCDIIFEHGKKQIFKSQRCTETKDDVISHLFTDLSFGALWNKIIKREIIRKHKVTFIENANMMEDRAWLIKVVYNCNKFKYCPDLYYHYNQMLSFTVSRPSSHEIKNTIEESFENIDSVRNFLAENKDSQWDYECNILEQIAKQHLLYSSSINDIKLWKKLRPKYNRYVVKLPQLAIRFKVLGILAYFNFFNFVEIWLLCKRIWHRVRYIHGII